MDDMGPEENLYDAGENEEAETYGQIYDTIVHWTTKQASATRQKEVDKWRSFIPTQKRDFCVKELLDTEMNYVEKALEIIVNKYFSPLKDHMTAEDHSTVFMNIVVSITSGAYAGGGSSALPGLGKFS